MYLESLTISRFRSCENLTVKLRPDLTVLVGENNGGKSNVIDAIRLLTLPLNGRRERYAEDRDLRRGSITNTFQVEGKFQQLGDTLKGLLISAVPDITKDEALFGYRYETSSESLPRGKSMFWAGKYDTNEAESGSTDLIRHVYLPPLRDAQQSLGSGSGSRVMALFRHFLTKAEEPAFLESVKRANTPLEILERMNTEIGSALSVLTSGVRSQKATLGFAAESLLDIARDLRFRLGDAGMEPDDIQASGLGYSNLLYMATVAVELAKARENDLTLFLVEEPEAHLHPQLQMLVLEFLLEQARVSSARKSEPGNPEGRVQIVATTHSPNLTAWVPPTHLVVLRSENYEQFGTSLSRTAAVPIAELGIKQKTLAKISRYLDVTRSSLLFGSRFILVEGIAEALLIPAIARNIVLAGDREAFLRFKASIVVPIDGVDFRPFLEILLRPHFGSRIADRVVVVTDADPKVLGNRKEDLEALALRHEATSCLRVLTNVQTLEYDFFKAGNEVFLKHVFLRLHRNSRADWVRYIEGADPADRPKAFLKLVETKRTRKGDLAQAIAAQLDDGESVVVPAYLSSAIREAVA